MELREGYKQTEIGLIPEDWEILEFGQISKPSNATINPKTSGGGDACIEMEHINKNTGSINGTTSTTSNSSIKNIFATNDILFGKLRSYLRKYYFANFDGVCSTEIWVLKPRSENMNNKYIYHLVQSDRFINICSEAYGTHMPRADWKVVSQEKFPIPPIKTEQTAIANALSDADAWIQSLTRLIAKKRQIKQGSMLELLQPKNNWVKKRLGETATLKARIGWQGLTTTEYLDNGDFFLVTGTEFKNGYIDWDNCHYVEESRYKQDKNIQLKLNDILVTKDGTIGKVALINQINKPATLNSGVFVIRPIKNAFEPIFFYYLLSSKWFFEFLNQLSAGSTINHLYQKDFVNFVYQTPCNIEEQAEIATILSNMDAEIASLESKLAKAQHIKQGMMQNLLTGRIRLI